MTDRIKGFYVALDKDYRTDDVEVILNAVKMIKGVSSVTKSVSDPNDWMNRSRIRMELQQKLFEVLKEASND